MTSVLFDSVPSVRYVATYVDGKLERHQRPGIANASEAESDKYEELIVNPTLLTLLRQRGNIDCGGVDYVVIRYGHFFQFLQPIPGGHISVALDADADVPEAISRIRAML
jgi:hypothetical protein